MTSEILITKYLMFLQFLNSFDALSIFFLISLAAWSWEIFSFHVFMCFSGSNNIETTIGPEKLILFLV